MPNTYKINTEKLIALRKVKAYSQEKMSELLLMDRSSYGKIERGETELTLRTAFKLAEVLNAKFEDFINLPTIMDEAKAKDEAVALMERAMNLLKLRSANK